MNPLVLKFAEHKADFAKERENRMREIIHKETEWLDENYPKDDSRHDVFSFEGGGSDTPPPFTVEHYSRGGVRKTLRPEILEQRIKELRRMRNEN